MERRIIDYSERNWQAKCIYGLIKEYWHDIEYVLKDTLTIENFENCRERGYTIKYKDKEVSFAENRNSDDIVVYPFKWDEENKEKAERNYEEKSKYFKTEEFRKVFDWILKYLGIEL